MANAGTFKKGEKKFNQGKRGPGKSTVEFRTTVQALLDENRDNVSKWLSDVAKSDPGRALDLLAKLAEFAAPKLGRVEHTGEGGGPLTVEIVRYGKDSAS